MNPTSTRWLYVQFWYGNDILYHVNIPASGTGVVSVTYDNTVGRKMYWNAEQVNTSSSKNRSSTSVRNYIGYDTRNIDYVRQSNRYLNGTLYHLCIFSAALTDDDRKIIERL